MQGVFHKHLDDKVRPCIDLIDSLRSFGVEEDLALPAIAVIGDQSSGKSSVLEALSGVALPRGSGIVTRCPLQLRLRSLRVGEKWKARISYKDTDGIDIHDPSQVEQHIINAQNALAGDGVGICEELITLEISSPDVCDLTLIDLPGIARVPVGDQPENIAEQTKHLISQFIRRNETIILVVVPCNIDIATTEALKMAKEVDPVGKRTLGILTKPDLVDRGTEQTILAVVRNQVIPLRKGYLLVKCRGQRQIDERVSLADVTQMERDFFEQHEFFKYLLREEKATTQCLASKLTEELVDQIKASLPSLSEQIQLQLHEVITELKQHDSGPPLEPEKMADYLSDILMAFNEKINALCTHGGVKRENLYSDLRPELSSWEAQLDESKEKFDAAVQAVVDGYEDQFRGRELPHFSDYNVFEAVVQDLVEKLKQPAMDTLKKTRQIVQKAFTSVAKTCFFQYPCLRNMALSKIDAIQTQQEAKVEKRIMEQFKMEQLVYTQDRIFHRVQEASGGSAEDCRAKYPNFLKSYYEVVYQRLADQVPMLILLFMLRESARLLSSEVIRLTYSTRVAELLREESEFSRRRIELLNRKNRLTKAQEKLNAFF